MIELTIAENINRAIERAKQNKLFVQVIAWRVYKVTNRENGRSYEVRFTVENGKRFGHCNCIAGEKNLACKHLAAAVSRHVVVAAERKASEQASAAA
jgi:uncharacterized Zn finger protein